MNDLLKKIGQAFLDMVETITIALSVWLVLYLFVLQPTKITGSSMMPTFQDQDCIITEKISYKLGLPRRGNVIALKAPPKANCPKGTGCVFFKRIIGLPGESVEVKNCNFVIDGGVLAEDYIPKTVCTNSGNVTQNGALNLKEDEYFVAGDNREHSSDSRAWGPIQRKDIVGKAIFRWCPADAVGVLP